MLFRSNTVYISSNSPQFVYGGVHFKGMDSVTSTVSFGNGANSYLSDAEMPVGFASYYSIYGVETSGAPRLTFENITLLGPQRGCTVFLSGCDQPRFIGDVWFGTYNANLDINPDAVVKYHLLFGACLRPDFTGCRFTGGAYKFLAYGVGYTIPGRHTEGAVTYNDWVNFSRTSFLGRAFAGLVFYGSGSGFGIIKMDDIVFGTPVNIPNTTGDRYWNVIVGGGAQVEHNQFSTECYAEHFLVVPNASGNIPKRGKVTNIPNVISDVPQSELYGGGSFSLVSLGGDFNHSCGHFDLSGMHDGNVTIRDYTVGDIPTDIPTYGIYTNGSTGANIDWKSPRYLFAKPDLYIENFDLSGSVSANIKTTSLGPSGYYATIRHTSLNLGNISGTGDAGNGGTKPVHHKISITMDVSNTTPLPTLKISKFLFTGSAIVKVSYSAAVSGDVTGFIRVLLSIGLDNAGIWTVKACKVLDYSFQNGYENFSENPVVFYGMIKNNSGGTQKPALYIGLRGGSSIGKYALMEAEFLGGVQLAGATTATYLASPVNTYTSAAVATTEIAEATGTIALTDMPQYLASATWNPGAIADKGSVTQAVTLTGCVIGDDIRVLAPYDLQGCQATASVTSANTATIVVSNLTGSSKTLASGTWKVINRGQP